MANCLKLVTLQIVAVMTEIFRTEPEKTEEATRELLTYDDEDIDLLAFLEYFSDNETIKNRFGEELYTHLLSTLGEDLGITLYGQQY